MAAIFAPEAHVVAEPSRRTPAARRSPRSTARRRRSSPAPRRVSMPSAPSSRPQACAASAWRSRTRFTRRSSSRCSTSSRTRTVDDVLAAGAAAHLQRHRRARRCRASDAAALLAPPRARSRALRRRPDARWPASSPTCASRSARSPTLLAFARRALPSRRRSPRWSPRCARAATTTTQLDDALALLYLAGVPVDWRAVWSAATPRRWVDLPTYAFQRERCWFPRGPSALQRPAAIRATRCSASLRSALHDVVQFE